jgi:hypothetical protein
MGSKCLAVPIHCAAARGVLLVPLLLLLALAICCSRAGKLHDNWSENLTISISAHKQVEHSLFRGPMINRGGVCDTQCDKPACTSRGLDDTGQALHVAIVSSELYSEWLRGL